MEIIYNRIAEILKTDQETALCTIVHTSGSTPLKAGAKMIVWKNGSIFGSVGGGKLEKASIDDALKVIKNKTPELFKHNLLSRHGMCCGGMVEIYIEPIMKKKNLYVFGAGHVGKAVAKYARDLDFEIFVIDDRENIFNDWDFEGFDKMNVSYQKVIQSLPFDSATYIVIATFDHATDREILAACVNKPYAYLGMIGSRNKIDVTRKMFISSGLADDNALDKVDMPIGLDIGAVTADEIAISIVAKLIMEKNK